MDRAVAHAALEALQGRHNAEQAALAAMRERRGRARASHATAPSVEDARRTFVRGFCRRATARSRLDD